VTPQTATDEPVGRTARLLALRDRIPSWVWPVVRAAALVAVVGVVADVGAHNYSSVRHLSLSVHPFWFTAVVPASLLAGLLMPLGWRRLLVAYGHRVQVGAALRIWWTAQITRYVPSGTAALATRVVLAGREGVSRWLAGASLPIEVAIIVGWSALLTGALLPSAFLPVWARALLSVSAAGALAVFPVLLRGAGRIVRRMPDLSPSGAPDVYGSVALYGLNALARSAAFAALAAAILPVHWSDVALLMGAFNAGSAAGLVSIAPGGLGVREGVLTLILRSRYGFGDAAALAVVLRAWDLCVDCVWLVTARLAARIRQRRDPVVVSPG